MKKVILILVLITSIVLNAILFFSYTSIPRYDFIRIHRILSYVGYAFWIALTFYSIEEKKPIGVSLLFLIPIIFNFVSNIILRSIVNITPKSISTIVNITSSVYTFIIILIVVLNLMYSKKPIYLIILLIQMMFIIFYPLSISVANYIYLINVIRDLLITLFLFIEINKNNVKESNSELVL